MSDVHSEQITVKCVCGKRLKAPATAVGRKAKCPKCGNVTTITLPKPPLAQRTAVASPQQPPVAIAPGEYEQGMGGLDLDALSQIEHQGRVAAEQEADSPAAQRCPSCAARLEPGAVLCVNCGYDLRTRRKVKAQAVVAEPEKPKPGWFRRARRKDRPADKMAPQGSFLVGASVSAGFAIAASFVWFFVAYYFEYDVYFLALLVGVAAGAGMQVGQKGYSTMGGIAAAGITLFAMLAAKAAVVLAILWPIVHAELNLEEFHNDAVVSALAEQDLKQRGIDPEDASDQQWEEAEKSAAERAKRLSPGEREEILRQQREEDLKDALREYVIDDVLKEQKIDPDDATDEQVAAAEKEASRRIDTMTPDKREAELKRHEEIAEAEAKKAAEEAKARRGSVDADDGPSTVAATGFLIFMLLVMFGWKSALFMIGALLLAYRTAAGSVHG